MTYGVLLFAHGARDARWADPFQEVAAQMRRAQPELPVALGFLEFMEPGLRGAGDSLVAAGCTQVDVVPLFLGAGGHVRKDVPVLLAALQAAHPQVAWVLRGAIGARTEVIAAMAHAALADLPRDTRR